MKKLIFIILLLSGSIFGQTINWSDVAVNYPDSLDDSTSVLYATARAGTAKGDTIRAAHINKILRMIRLLQDKVGIGGSLPTVAGRVLKVTAAGDSTYWGTDATGSGGSAYADSITHDSRRVTGDSLITDAEGNARFLLLTNFDDSLGLGVKVQAYDLDLVDLTDGSLTASKVAGVANADYGDITVAAGVWSVEDNSHSHTTYLILSNFDDSVAVYLDDAHIPDDLTLTNISQITNRAITDLSGTAYRVIWLNSVGAVTEGAVGAAGTVWKSNGATSEPTWQTDATGAGGSAYSDSVTHDARHVPGDSLITDAEGVVRFQPLDTDLTDLADLTIAGNFINTANPWADNEVANDIALTNITQITNRALTNLTAGASEVWYSSAGGTIGSLTWGNRRTYLQVVDNLGTAVLDFDYIRASNLRGGTTTDEYALTYEATGDSFQWAPLGMSASVFDDSLAATTSDEIIADFIGTMVTGNTETNITVTYQDDDNTLDFIASAGGSADSIYKSVAIDTFKARTDTIRVIDPVRLEAGSGIFGLQTVDLDSGIFNIVSMANHDYGDITWNDVTVNVDAGAIGTNEIGTDGVSADELNATGVESELEAVLDLDQLQGAVTDGQVPNTISLDLLPAAGTNPTTDAAGEISVDTDDDALELYSSVSRIIPSRQVGNYTILYPDSVRSRSDDVQVAHFPAEIYPFGITIFYVSISTPATVTDTHVLEEWSDAVGTGQVTIESLALSGASKVESTAIDDGAFAADAYLNINLDDTPDNVNQLIITVGYYVNPGD